MSRLLQREIQKLNNRILTLGTRVEETVQQAVKVIEQRDADLAAKIIQGDIIIDQMEVDLEEECLKILALHQPVAIDLRFIIAVLKINNELERIADLAVNIAERGEFLATQKKINIPFDFPTMSKMAQNMLIKSLDSLVNMNTDLAYNVCSSDDKVDAINREMYLQIEEGIRKHPDQINCLLHLLCVSRHLERIADHATNISEYVIYMVQGDIIRHHPEKYVSVNKS